jgi:hypothetical protein
MRNPGRSIPAVTAFAVFVSAPAAFAPAQQEAASDETVYARPALPDSDGVDEDRLTALENRIRSLTAELEAAREELRQTVTAMASSGRQPQTDAVDAVVEQAERAAELKRKIRKTNVELAMGIAGGAPTRRLRYVASVAHLASWRKPTEYGEPQPYHYHNVDALAEFTDPRPNSGTVHPFAVVAHFEYGGRNIAVAIDAADADADAPNAAQVDMSGEGLFHDARMLAFHRGGGIRHEYGPAVVPLDLDGEEIPFVAWGRYDRWDAPWGPWYITMFEGYVTAEGLVEIAGRQYPVRLIDSSKNWKLGDAPEPAWDFEPFWSGDSLTIETGDNYFTDPDTLLKIWYGQPVEIDGRLYDIRLSADGERLEAEALSSDEVGTLRVPGADGWWGVLVSREHVMNVSADSGTDVLAPVGTYHVHTMGVRSEDGSTRGVDASRIPETVRVQPDGVTEIDVP